MAWRTPFPPSRMPASIECSIKPLVCLQPRRRALTSESPPPPARPSRAAGGAARSVPDRPGRVGESTSVTGPSPSRGRRCRLPRASQARTGRASPLPPAQPPRAAGGARTAHTHPAVICAVRWGHGALVPGLSVCCVGWAGVLCALDRQQRATATVSGYRAGRTLDPSHHGRGQRAVQVGWHPDRPVFSGATCPGIRMRALAGRVPTLLTAAGASPRCDRAHASQPAWGAALSGSAARTQMPCARARSGTGRPAGHPEPGPDFPR
jgi:hypothetical protein